MGLIGQSNELCATIFGIMTVDGGIKTHRDEKWQFKPLPHPHCTNCDGKGIVYEFKEGDTITLDGLTTLKSLNGQTGTLHKWLPPGWRFKIWEKTGRIYYVDPTGKYRPNFELPPNAQFRPPRVVRQFPYSRSMYAENKYPLTTGRDDKIMTETFGTE